MNIYAGSLIAKKYNDMGFAVGHLCSAVAASNKDEAVGKLLRYCNENFPISEGYQEHQVISVCEIPTDWIIRNLGLQKLLTGLLNGLLLAPTL